VNVERLVEELDLDLDDIPICLACLSLVSIESMQATSRRSGARSCG
jgi:hypothetical protein